MGSYFLLLVISVFSLGSVFHGSHLAFTATDPNCDKSNCACCIDNKCILEAYRPCTKGCKDGHRGLRCYELCLDNCKSCPVTGQCSTCYDGFYLYQNTQCLNCPLNCKTCSSSTVCTICKEGYENRHGSTACEYSLCPGNCICTQSNCEACKEGFFDTGSSCSRLCPDHCVSCSSLAVCRECTAGYYNGNKLVNSINLLFNNCTHQCRETCVSCSSYDQCLKCIHGKYGQRCLSNCSIGCVGSTCSIHTGKCECKMNFYGSKCDECVVGKYGDVCNKTCPVNCKGNVCDRWSGNCTDGCKMDRFTGKKCNTCKGNFNGTNCVDCKHGKYGRNCEEDCPENCLNSICDKNSGDCSGCIGNFDGEKCKICISGYFGPECIQNCSSNCLGGTCNKFNGTCDSGCKANFSGDKCCIKNENCLYCNSNSECKECKPGFYGELCDTICPTYCNRSGNENVSECGSADGRCLFGCQDGFFGFICNETCRDYCIDTVCEMESGLCLKGCSSNHDDFVCSLSQVQPPGKDPPVSLIEPVIGSVVALVVVVVGVIVAVIFIRRRRLRNDTIDSDVDHLQQVSKGQTAGGGAIEEGHVYANMSDNNAADVDVDDVVIGQRDLEVSEGDGADYYNFEHKNLRVKVADLFSYVTKDHVGLFDKEFKNLPKPDDLSKLCKVAKKPENIALNRYNGIYPFDHSRVTIPSQPKFFINACYIDGYNRRKAYIASFGPTSKTTHHFTSFWQMVWHEKSDIIVMLTNLHEESGMKCEQYWPDADTEVNYGHVKVACRSVEEFAEYTIRMFTISKGQEQRSLTQLHFTAWPDKGVPSEVTSLVEFRQRVKAVPITLHGPVIVHCSAGVGRTGTYIALDILTEQGKAEDLVDVFHCVSKMRDQRVNMVQTAEQYKFLHKALVHSLTFDCEAVTAEQIQSMAFKGDEIITRMYTTLQKEVDVEKEEDIETREENRRKYPDKSRRHSDIPGDRGRVRLFLSRKSGNYDYINAVFINSFKIRNLFIAAQTPLPSTAEDFLCLIYQQNASCVVALESPLSTSKKSDVGKYLPADNETYRCGDFTVTSSKFESQSQYVLKKLSIQNAEKGESKTVYHFQYTQWRNDHKVADSAADFVHFVKEVEKYIGQNDTPHIIVHCLNGYERSGLFCVVYKALEKLEAERQVSVVNIVRKIRSQRRLAITSVEQLKFCYQCISTYLESYNTYSNFAVAPM